MHRPSCCVCNCCCSYCTHRMLKFLGIITVEAFAASALGMFIGAAAKSEDAALALGPALMTVFILFSGFYISQASHSTVGASRRAGSHFVHAAST